MNTPSTPQAPLPRIAIEYCTGCRWLLRAAWMAQELLTTFEKEVAEVALRPGSGGVFRISIDEQTLWDRKLDGGFPDIKQLKQLVRDRVAPDKTLGHSERAAD
ncbi:selenoprotein W-related protein [Aquitalea sp. FJL05]|uniref:SelT/SelW/SelH family protein n=1 Tax=Aquitalea TaxID=407217 RepID=UPI000F5942EC|nr:MULTISPECIES: SelT/SelW/SelH family protein [Aquitalea]RQO67065.1 selenoprotein W-related protein [Aquitalea sp. FJL05]